MCYRYFMDVNYSFNSLFESRVDIHMQYRFRIIYQNTEKKTNRFYCQ